MAQRGLVVVTAQVEQTDLHLGTLMVQLVVMVVLMVVAVHAVKLRKLAAAVLMGTTGRQVELVGLGQFALYGQE